MSWSVGQIHESVNRGHFTIEADDRHISCDGSKFDKLKYPILYEVLKRNTVPDLRGRVITDVLQQGHSVYRDTPWDERTGFPKNKLRRINA